MALFRGPIQKLSKEDIEKVLADQLPEDAELEFKREIEVDASGRVRDGSRNDVAREVVAFANADGGTILVGIEESSDEPKRAIAIKPLEKVHELAERLRRAIIEIIEPKLPVLHSRAVEIDGTSGVIISQFRIHGERHTGSSRCAIASAGLAAKAER